MPLRTPARRWQPTFSPFESNPFAQGVLQSTELAVKGPLLGYRMCGDCLPQETALIYQWEKIAPRVVADGGRLQRALAPARTSHAGQESPAPA